MGLGKSGVAIIALIVGMILLFEGATPLPKSARDGAAIALGAALVLSYFVLIEDSLNRMFRTKSSAIIFMPIILVLGILVLVQATAGTGLTFPSKISLLILGGALVVASTATFIKAVVGKKR